MEETVAPRRGLTYQSQEVVGRMERVDATGAFSGCRGLAFVPSPPPGFLKKDYRVGRFVTARSSLL